MTVLNCASALLSSESSRSGCTASVRAVIAALVEAGFPLETAYDRILGAGAFAADVAR